ncbi:MAG: hypothetical protein BGN97_07655 [Microbacterium sp. 69-10]|uniref:hypothetical protein n=1 Tax=Microbacterium sp. 69-10 TaxID=1895783 RepID=UPI00095AB8B1|nr:hypothetical protein [Microbacterium sp. 69-10]OJU42384.1 MAG: hypothetical protein BGN97_07655 [Microbacterium sp. 69-10]
MVFHERAAWAGLIAAVVTVGVYIWLLPRADAWVGPMLWAIGTGIAVSILITILWGIAAGIRDREAATASDLRDRDISRYGGRAEYVVLVIAGLVVIVLCALGAEGFWVANAMFAGFVLAAVIGGLARVIAYRRGLA